MQDLIDKVCSKCCERKEASNFYASRNVCRSCHKAWRENYESMLDPELKRERTFINSLWKRYRLRPEAYQKLISNGCAVCGTTEGLCIDDDHDCCPGERTCGKCIRGVLCKRHNFAEGCLSSLEEIFALAVYRMNFEGDSAI